MSGFSTLLLSGVERMWKEDTETQTRYLDIIAEERGISIDLLKKANAFFIPNDDYLAWYCGDEIRDYEYDCYRDDVCKWSNWLVVPITDIVGEVVGLGGFNPFIYAEVKETERWDLAYYQYSSSNFFKKSRYLYSPPGNYEKAIDDGYVFVVDGLFDAIALVDAGYNAVALMGSDVSTERVVLLRFVKRVILLADNDDAGIKLYKKLDKRVRGLEWVKQGKTKDIDELLKSEYREKALRELERVKRGETLIVHTMKL